MVCVNTKCTYVKIFHCDDVNTGTLKYKFYAFIQDLASDVLTKNNICN